MPNQDAAQADKEQKKPEPYKKDSSYFDDQHPKREPYGVDIAKAFETLPDLSTLTVEREGSYVAKVTIAEGFTEKLTCCQKKGQPVRVILQTNDSDRPVGAIECLEHRTIHQVFGRPFVVTGIEALIARTKN